MYKRLCIKFPLDSPISFTVAIKNRYKSTFTSVNPWFYKIVEQYEYEYLFIKKKTISKQQST